MAGVGLIIAGGAFLSMIPGSHIIGAGARHGAGGRRGHGVRRGAGVVPAGADMYVRVLTGVLTAIVRSVPMVAGPVIPDPGQTIMAPVREIIVFRRGLPLVRDPHGLQVLLA